MSAWPAARGRWRSRRSRSPTARCAFALDGEEVALFAPAPQAVPAELRRSFARFLRLRLPIHPDILAAVELDGRLPQRLVIVGIANGDRRPHGDRLEVGQAAGAAIIHCRQARAASFGRPGGGCGNSKPARAAANHARGGVRPAPARAASARRLPARRRSGAGAKARLRRHAVAGRSGAAVRRRGRRLRARLGLVVALSANGRGTRPRVGGRSARDALLQGADSPSPGIPRRRWRYGRG